MKAGKLNIALFHLALVYSGGGERLVLEEAIGLQKLGHSVTIFTPIVDKRYCFPELLKKVRVMTLIPKLPMWLPDVELFSILLACFLTPLLFWKFKAFDVYFGANQPGPWIAYMLSKLNRKPYAIYLAQPTRLIHPRLIDQMTELKIVDGISLLPLLAFIFKPIINFLDRKSITSTPLVFANGTYMTGVLNEVYGIHAINCPAASNLHPGVTVQLLKKRFTGSVKIGKNTIAKPYILLTNRHFPQKKFEYGLEAHRMLLETVSLVVAGKYTNYTKHLKKLTRNRSDVFFVGLLSEKELDKAYKNAAVYVYPSPQEDFGMGIVEAMSCGIPTVAWANAGPTGIITHRKDGFLATPFVVHEFVASVHELLHSKKLYLSIARNAQKTVREKFSFAKHNALLSSYLVRLTKQADKMS